MTVPAPASGAALDLGSQAGPAGSGQSATMQRESAGIPAVAASMLSLMLGPSAILLLSFGTFMPALHATFGWSVPAISFGASIIAITIMLASPIQGYLVDRFGSRPVVLTFLPIWGLALILMQFLPPRIEIFYLACFLLPLAALGIWPLAYMKVATTWFDRHVGLAMGAVNLSVGLAAAVLPVVLAFAFARVGWRGAYVGLGVAVLVLVWPVVAIWFRQGPRGSALPGGTAPLGIGFSEAVRTRVFWMMIVNFLILGIISTGLLIHEVAILIDAGISPARAITIQSAIGLGSIVGRIGAGWLLDRFSVQKIGIAVFVIAAGSCLLLASSLAADLAVVAAATLGIILGAEFDVLGVLIRRYQGIAAFGRIFGIVFSAFQLGGALGAGGVGLIRASTGSYSPVLVGMAAMCAVGGTLFLFFGAYRFPPEHRASSRTATAG